jgi:hypothetical protein
VWFINQVVIFINLLTVKVSQKFLCHWSRHWGHFTMNNQTHLISNQLYDSVNACLCKAEALAIVAATADLEAYDPKVLNNYLWTLSDLVREARWLFEKTYHKL